MKLLVCTSEYYPYGSGTANRTYNIVTQLQKMGVNCTVCSPTGPDIKLGSCSMITRFGRMGLLYYWYQVAKYFKETADDHDVAWLNYPLFITANPFQRSLITVVSTAYGKITHRMYPLPLHLYYKVSFRIEKYCLRKVSNSKAKFTTLTPQGVAELRGIGVSPRHIMCIPNGVDTERFKPPENKRELRKKFNLPENELMLLSVGSLIEVKQPHKLIEVFSLVEKRVGNITLVIAGGGKLLKRTKRLAQQKGLNNVRFLGHVNHDRELPDLYACSDYYIMTSKYEGLPLALLEAMASGLPCIASDILSLRSVVEEAKCGIMVDFNDEDKAAQQIVGYLGRDNSEHARNAREYMVKNLTWEIVAQQYLKEFEKLQQT